MKCSVLIHFVSLVVLLLIQGQVGAQSIDLTSGTVQWQSLVNTDGLFGWRDATASVDGINFNDGDHFDDALGLRVGGVAYGGDIAQAVVNGNTITLPSQSIGGLNVQVQFQGSNTPFMRQLISLSNPTGALIATNVQWINNTGNDSSQNTIGTSSGDLLSGLDDRWIVTADTTDLNADGSETNLWVIYGPDNPTVTTSGVVMSEAEANFGGAGSEGLTTDMSVNIPAGQTVYVMYFVGATTTGQEALTLATSFDDTDSSLFQSLISDLTQDQINALVNWINVTLNLNYYQNLGLTRNQMGMGLAFDLIFTGSATGDAATVKTILDGLTDSQKRILLQQAVPQIGMASTGALLSAQQTLGQLLNNRTLGQLALIQSGRYRHAMSTTLAATDNAGMEDAVSSMNKPGLVGTNLWVQSINSFGDQDTDTNAAGYNWKSFGGAMGVDHQINDQFLAGISFAGYGTHVDGANNSGEADITTLNLSAYSGYINGPTHVQGGITLGLADNSTKQPYPLLGVTAKGDYESTIFGSWLSIGHELNLDIKCPVKVEPTFGLHYLHIHDEAYTQTDGGIMNMSINEQNTDSLVTRLGLNLLYDLKLAQGQELCFGLGAFWCHEMLDDQVAGSGTMAGNGFAVDGISRGRDAVEVAGKMGWQLKENMLVQCDYAGQFANNWDSHMIKLGLLINF